MEESNQLTKPNTGDRDHIIPTQNHLISSHLTTRKQFQSQVIRPKKANRNSESSIISLDDSFTYDFSNVLDVDSMLIEMLSRLPLKSVFKFKCVCKHWLSLISHSSFKTFYFSHTQTAHPSFRILYKYNDDSDIEGLLDRLTHDSSDSIYSLYRDRDPKKIVKFMVMGVSNGLVLFYSWEQHIYYVCDPVTRQRVSLPKISFAAYYGVAFVTRIDEHNVVTSFTVVVVSSEMMSPSHYLTLNTFSSETGEWLEYSLPCPSSIRPAGCIAVPIVFNGIPHWFFSEQGMVAFDPHKDPKSYRLVQLPDDKDVPRYKFYQLCDSCQGRLRFFQVTRDVSSFYCFSMWDMKDYEKGEWCSEFKVTRSDLSSSDPKLNSLLKRATFLPLCFDPFNLDIVYMRCVELNCVVLYSIQNRKLEVGCKLSDVAHYLYSHMVPYVIPRWPTRVPVPPGRKKVFKS